MKGYATSALISIVMGLIGSAAGAQSSNIQPPASAPPADDDAPRQMTPEQMRQVHHSALKDQPAQETHAQDATLERPAASQNFRLPMMSGMDTDMNDDGVQHRVWLEYLEGSWGAKNGSAWDAHAWLGGDFDKLWIKTEGNVPAGKTRPAKAEAFWAHAILPFWDTQLGVRHDFSGAASREWAAFGVQGVAPYWFDVELTGYLGQAQRTAVRLKTEYEIHLTQRLIFKPEIELNAYGKPDRAHAIGAGLSDGQFAVRLRYEFTRRFAPYVGYLYERKLAGSATLARQAGDTPIDHRAVAGVQFLF